MGIGQDGNEGFGPGFIHTQPLHHTLHAPQGTRPDRDVVRPSRMYRATIARPPPLSERNSRCEVLRPPAERHEKSYPQVVNKKTAEFSKNS